MRWCLILLAISILLHAPTPINAQAERGRLTITVRDPHGQPLSAVALQVAQDTDDQGRIAVGTFSTNRTGDLVLPDLPYGLYILTFVGTTPTGQPLQPARDQNRGLAEDGTGIDGGFGLRFTEPRFTLLFVLDPQRGIPMFDMATDRTQPPQPFDATLELLTYPTPFVQAPAYQRAQMAHTPPHSLWCWSVLGGISMVGLLLMARGWWRIQKGPTP